MELPSQKTTFTDPVTGRTVHRLTTGGVQPSPYFNNNAFTADSAWVFYLDMQADGSLVMACEITTGRRVRLAGPYHSNVWTTLNAIPGTDTVSYVADNAVWRVAIGGEPVRVAELPPVENPGIGDSDISGDGRWHVLGLIRQSDEAVEAGKSVGWPPDEHYARYQISTLLVRVDLHTGAVEELWEEPAPAVVDHISVNPLDPDLILYCHEGALPYQYGRMFLRRVGESVSRPLRDQRSGKVKVTHERWFADGTRIAYHGLYLTENQPTRHYVGIYDLARELPLEYPLDRPDLAAWHSTAAPDGSRMAMDQQAGHTGIYLLTLDTAAGVWRTELATSVCSDMEPLAYDQLREQDPIWSPDGHSILFRAASKGEVSVYLVEV